MRAMNRILYSGFKWPHHDALSGYDQVVPRNGSYVDGGRLPGGRRHTRSLRGRINMFLIDLVTCARALAYDCVIIFYPEQSIYVSPVLLRMTKVKVIYVVHLNDEYWFERDDSVFLRLKRWNMRFVDHFIVLSRTQLQSFGRRFPGKTTLVPHGVWCDRVPAQRATPSPSIVIVGDNYRDYEFMKAVITRFGKLFPEVRFDLVGVDRTKLQLDGTATNVTLHGRLSTELYRDLLSECLFVFLPITFATANNALLEGLSLGTPVVCSDVPGVRDYLMDKSYVVSNVEDVVQFYLRQSQKGASAHLSEAERLLEYCRRNFDWRVIRQRVIAVAEKVVKGSSTEADLVIMPSQRREAFSTAQTGTDAGSMRTAGPGARLPSSTEGFEETE
jgi:glycosyltransferase involved in cell wall biosynthesis